MSDRVFVDTSVLVYARDASLLEDACGLQDRHALSFWDALVVAAAVRLGCSHLLSEDLQDGQSLDGVTVVNPFVHAAESILSSGQ